MAFICEHLQSASRMCEVTCPAVVIFISENAYFCYKETGNNSLKDCCQTKEKKNILLVTHCFHCHGAAQMYIIFFFIYVSVKTYFWFSRLGLWHIVSVVNRAAL